MSKSIVVFLLSVFLLAACGEPKDTRPGQPVAHRRTAFKQMLKAFEPMGVMLRTDKYDAEKFRGMLSEFMARRDAPWRYFAAGTLYPPSHAKPEVWSDAADFAAGKKVFFDTSDKLAALAGSKDKNAVYEAYEAVQKSCRSCHKRYKTE